MTEQAGEQDMNFLLGTTQDNRVLIDFRGRPLDHLKLTPDQALEMAEGLESAARHAKGGVVILTGGGIG